MKKNNYRSFIFIYVISFLFLSTFSVHAAKSYSAISQKAIIGNAPYLLLTDRVTKLSNLNQLQGFNMPRRDGHGGIEWLNAWDSSVAIRAPEHMHFSDVWTLVPADGNFHNVAGVLIGDDDGDEKEGTISGTMKATWYDNNIPIPNDRLNWELWNCGGPYTLKVEVNDVSVTTRYGIPNSRFYGSAPPVVYTFMPYGQGICYLKPNEMTNYGGHDSSVFNEINGFSRWSGFPTTGFKKAGFSLIGSGADQTRYRCYSHNGAGKISLWTAGGIAQNCSVIYESATKGEFIQNGTPTITMEYFNGQSWIWLDNFTIPVPNKWARAGSSEIVFANNRMVNSATRFPALDFCRGSRQGRTTKEEAMNYNFRRQYLYDINELTNNWDHFIRAVGTFMGEWGITQRYGGIWSKDGERWTSELEKINGGFFGGKVYRVMGLRGNVSLDRANYPSTIAVCRGD
ncbi:hypothetical protein A9G42_06130 [Gilliamella sp. Nev6-6]|uniref:hypothetical protein n=1 Tax=Gilliamella sp. Nev6-6 TaxID=3120252 RepID=UPI00080F4711|nr:hypothetical protein [Gilliamella apicola]OCG76885.1 hypothetical protein A9G42_06130 [Gilliamella apicola]